MFCAYRPVPDTGNADGKNGAGDIGEKQRYHKEAVMLLVLRWMKLSVG